MQSIWTWVIAFLEANLEGLVAAIVVALFSLYLKLKHLSAADVLVYVRRLIFFPLAWVLGRKVILVFSDAGSDEPDEEGHDCTVAESLILELEKKPAHKSHVFKAVGDADWFLRWPLMPQFVYGVVILVSDVTRLSNQRERRERIQKRLISYVRNGGVLITAHDVPYRRTKNFKLQTFLGFRATRFVPSPDPVVYERPSSLRKTSNAALDAALPDTFALDDREVVSGDFEADVEFLYTWGNRPQTAWPDYPDEVPLVTRRTRAKGAIFWVNSGDQDQSGPPLSLAQPSPQFVTLLSCLLEHR